ncbi:MAG: HPF/RaiA family ribosome-associated protein [Gemmatimonadaceae bacterium]
MEIVFHAHHAVISDRMRTRVERAIEKLAHRLRRTVTAVVRFEQDGPTRRVEILLQTPRQPDLVAEGRSRYYGPALNESVEKLRRQIARRKRTVLRRTRKPARAL